MQDTFNLLMHILEMKLVLGLLINSVSVHIFIIADNQYSILLFFYYIMLLKL